MLNALRKSASTWVAKVLIGLLVLSFAIWGVNDFIGGINRTTVATVGETDVSAQRFDRALSIEISRVQRQIQQPVSLSQAVAFGIPNQVMSSLVSEAALDDVSTKLNLGVSDEKLRGDIVNNPSFRGPDGQFDRTFLQQILQSNNMTESEFVSDQRSFSERRQIALGISGGIGVPDTLLQALHSYRAETRKIRTISMDVTDLGSLPEPSESDLKSYFEANTSTYRAPEYRSVSLIHLTLADLIDADAVSDGDARRVYDEQAERFSQEEQRRVQQLVFPTKEEADAASAKLASGTSWEDTLAERNVSASDIDLGLVAKEDMIDQTIADAVFSVGENGVTKVIEGRFGAVLAFVAEVQPASTRPYEDVAIEIKGEIARDEAIDQIFNVRDMVEDGIAGGASLSEVAGTNNLTLRSIDGVDRNGLDTNSNVINDLPLSTDLLAGVYESEVGVENPPLEGDNEFVWYEVSGLTPERDRTIDEVTDRLSVDWIRDETAKALDKLAAGIAGNLTSSVSFEALAQARVKAVNTIDNITRVAPTEGLTPENVTAIFDAKLNKFASMTPSDPAQRLIFQLTDATVPAYFAEEQATQQIAQAAGPTIEGELLQQYVAELQGNLGVTLNQPLLTQMLSNEGQGQYQ
ncbi:MAG: SurA N-terminal domain-containing protein [Hyphomicrobiales bacterium]